jgi:hypothetical protein
VTSITTTEMPITWPLRSVILLNEADLNPVWSGPGVSRSTTVRPVESTSCCTEASSSPVAPGMTSLTVRPMWSSRGRPFILASAWLTRT